jgi:hypothetical protein
MLASTITRRIATVVAAAALTMTAVVADANASVRFADGYVMGASISCNFGVNYTVQLGNSGGVGYADTQIWNQQTARWIFDSGWVKLSGPYVGGWGRAWTYGHGWFTFRNYLGRHVNGQWTVRAERDFVCLF